jgi:O-antigen ligase
VADRVKDLLVNLATEERVYFWKSASEMLNKNSLTDWIFGNGIGSYRAVYPEYSTPELRPFFFAHLHPLEILYENGFTGVVLVYGGLAVLFGLAIKTLINTISENLVLLMKCMFVIFLCWMIHSNLTFPFYSKYAQYPFGFILGTMLVLIDQSNLATKNRTAPAME